MQHALWWLHCPGLVVNKPLYLQPHGEQAPEPLGAVYPCAWHPGTLPPLGLTGTFLTAGQPDLLKRA